MSAALWLALLLPGTFIVGFMLGSMYAEIGRRLIWLEEFDPTEALAGAWDVGFDTCMGGSWWEGGGRADNPYREVDS